jgi:hypothetical protein
MVRQKGVEFSISGQHKRVPGLKPTPESTVKEGKIQGDKSSLLAER